MLPWKLRKCQILPVSQNLSSVYFSLAKFQLVSCNPSLAKIWQMTCTHKLPKLCSATSSKQCTNSQFTNFTGKNGILIITAYILGIKATGLTFKEDPMTISKSA